MPAKTCLQIKPLYYFSSQMSVILILSIGSLKSFYCCFRTFFFLISRAAWHAWRVTIGWEFWLGLCALALVSRSTLQVSSLWMSFTARVSESRPAHLSQFLSRLPSELCNVLNPRLSFSTLSVSPLSLTAFSPPNPLQNVCDVPQECGSLRYSVLQNNLNGTKTPAIFHNLSLGHPFYFCPSPALCPKM